MFEWVVGVIVAGGLIGVALLMFAENVAPPIPSEVIMPLAGFAAAQGHLSFPGVVAAGTVGAVAGAWLWYALGRGVPESRLRRWIARFGRWLTIDNEDLDKAQRYFARRGGWAVFLGRLAPGIRTFVSVPAGVGRMPAWRFLIWTSLGTAVWTLALASLGYVLASEHHKVEAWLDPVSKGVLGLVAVFYLWRVIRYRPARREAPAD